MVFTPFWQDPWQNLSQMIWPALAVGYRYSAVATRMTRSAMLEVLREDYIRTARAKGLWQSLIVRRHALKNAMLPVLTVIGLEFAFLIGGLVVTEQVFNLNGTRTVVRAVRRPAGLYAGAGAGPAGGLCVYPGEFRRGSALRLARSTHPVSVMLMQPPASCMRPGAAAPRSGPLARAASCALRAVGRWEPQER